MANTTQHTQHQFLIEIDLGNEAMSEPEHVASALRQVARNITETPNGWPERGPFTCAILDANGNITGLYRLVGDPIS